MDSGNALFARWGQGQPFNPSVAIFGFFPDIAGSHKPFQHPANAGFFEVESGAQIAGGRATFLYLDQRMDG